MKMREEEKAWASQGQQVWGQSGSGASGSGTSGASGSGTSGARSRSLPTCAAALHLPKGPGQVLEVVQAVVVLAVQQDLLGV